MKTFVVADWHLGEDRFELMGRPFEGRLQHMSALIHNHNELVAPEDEVIVVGDVCYQKTPEFLDVVRRFNGKKTLIRGNHDKVFTDEQLKRHFIAIIDEGEGMKFDGIKTAEGVDIPLYITHYPTEGVKDRFNLVGHIHAAWKYQLNMLNIGVDVHHFRPVNLDTIPFHLGAISKFYDADVWVAYRDLNKSYFETRGKKNSYFRP